MATDLLKNLDDLKGIWTMGGAAMEKTPQTWRDAIKETEWHDLALLALAGQAISFTLRPIPARDLSRIPPLPPLTYPTPPEPAREIIQVLLRTVKVTDNQMTNVIKLLAARGYAVNPIDYLPKNYEQLPEWYHPWEAWFTDDQSLSNRGGSARSSDDASSQPRELDANNWDQWLPSERRQAWLGLRRQQPAVARELFAEKRHAMTAEERFRFLMLLNDDLSADDQLFLEPMLSDRSSKVKQLVTQYLARLGASPCLADDCIEFASYFSVANTDLNGSVKITANPLKTPAQKKRRSLLSSQLSLQSFAVGLKLDSEEALVNSWEHVDPQASEEFVRMVSSSGNDRSIALLARRIESLDGISADALRLLFGRLSSESRRELLPRVLKNDDASFEATIMCCGDMLGEISYREISSTLALKELLKLCRDEKETNPMQRDKLRHGLFSLGLLVDRNAAAETIELFTSIGLFASDPLLSVLKLNTSLPLNDCFSKGVDCE